MDRGYSLDRGKGQRKRGSRRGACPSCKKKGLPLFAIEDVAGGCLISRTCRYCSHLQIKKFTGVGSEFLIENHPPRGK